MLRLTIGVVLYACIPRTKQHTKSPFLSPEDILNAKRTLKRFGDAAINLDLRPKKSRNIAYWPNDQVMGEPYEEMTQEVAEDEILGQESPSRNYYSSRKSPRRGDKLEDYKWPNGTIPYKFMDDFSPQFKMLFAMQVYLFRLHTCVRFVPFEPKKHDLYISIIRNFEEDGGCSASVGRTSFGSKIPEMHMHDENCRSTHDVSHEMMHVIGFRHEHQRIDRDDYVKVFLENVESGSESNFVKGWYLPDRYRYMPYNIKSILHYPYFAFSKAEGLKTIVALNGKLPRRTEITPMDYSSINLHYKCGEESKECKDLLPNDTCSRIGKGIVKTEENHVEPVMLVERAKCLDEYFAKLCKRTCGKCNQFSTRKHKTYEEWNMEGKQDNNIDEAGMQESPMQLRSNMPCIDDEVHCQVWAEDRLCSTGQNVKLVRKLCSKTCEACDRKEKRRKYHRSLGKYYNRSQSIQDTREQVAMPQMVNAS